MFYKEKKSGQCCSGKIFVRINNNKGLLIIDVDGKVIVLSKDEIILLCDLVNEIKGDI